MKMSEVLKRAKAEGRICTHCGWIVSKRRWKKGERLCTECKDGLKGVNVKYGHWPYEDDYPDKTGR